ncbi:TBC1 domain, member 5 [Dissophora globulifera]|uniref:TBC1 domain, member 5 n=1 Tax=Dissophora globulifera TaxID=979702 RepID=A0A9P6RHK2_9FUNG|nr:TBC1 domain, member 5 [Dissophora globulifera]
MNTLKGAWQSWAEVFEDPNLTLDSLKARAVSQNSNLAIDGIRSVCWKVYLSCLPSLELSTWPFAMTKERERYVELRRKYIRAVGADDGPEPDLEVNNPLSLAEDSPWQQFFVDSELRKIIKQDVDRTLPDIDFFRSEKVQEQLNDILFIYCKINHDVSYRQGMHELVAHILWVVSSESVDINADPGSSSDSTLNVMKSVLDSNYIEHDSFALFSSLMRRAKPWYEFSDEGPSSRKLKPNASAQTQPFGRPEVPEPIGKQTPVIEWSLKIFYHLEKVDNELFLHLKSLEIQPQLFGIRWFRLLFGREFPMEDALCLWDGIFAKDPSLNICIFIGLTLLLRIRDDLLEEDFAGCLHKLMRYPAVKDVRIFIPQALTLQKSPNAAGGHEIIRQNNILAGKPVPAPPSLAAEADHGGGHSATQLQHQHGRAGSPSLYSRQQGLHHPQQHHDQTKSSHFSSNGALIQHLPPAALDAIKPVADGFAHVTKNVLESKGGAAINKAISDMRKNTQSYIRKANSPTPSPTTANFPPMFDQVAASNSKPAPSTLPTATQQRSAQSTSKPHPTGVASSTSTDKQLQLQLGQIVAKALVILETEFLSSSSSASPPSDSEDSTKVKEDGSKTSSKAALAAISGLEHVRDILLGFSKDVNPLVIETGMLESSVNAAGENTQGGNGGRPTSTATPPILANKPQLDLPGAVTNAAQRKPINATATTTTTKIGQSSPSLARAGSPIRSTYDTPNDERSLSRASSLNSGIVSATGQSRDVDVLPQYSTTPTSTPLSGSEIYVPTPPPPVITPKPFSFDDLIEDTNTDSGRSTSPSLSGSRRGANSGVAAGGGGGGSALLGAKLKSPRSSLAHKQFSWMLSDEDSHSAGSGAGPLSGAGGGSVHSSPSGSSLSSISKGAGSGGGLRPAAEIISPSATTTRIKIDPLAGSVSKRSGSGSSTMQEDDPLRM